MFLSKQTKETNSLIRFKNFFEMLDIFELFIW